jgi:aryl-alcohol dehydrogenase-like predicted oxidoreductase
MGDEAPLSRICFGCEPLGGTDWGEVDLKAIADAIEAALEIGINFFDTAAVYGLGLSEERLANILGCRRHDVVIATKGGLAWTTGAAGGRATVSRDSSPRQLRIGIEGSLRRLRLECLPVYYVHWPDPHTELRYSFEFLMKLRTEGRIGRIGCSNFSAAQVRAACEVSDVSLVQLPLNLLEAGLGTEMDETLAGRNIGLVAYNVLASGLLTGKFDQHTCFGENDRRSRLPLFKGEAYREALRRVSEIAVTASKQGLTPAQYAIAGVLRRPGVVSVVLGIKNRAQLEENATGLSLSVTS